VVRVTRALRAQRSSTTAIEEEEEWRDPAAKERASELQKPTPNYRLNCAGQLDDAEREILIVIAEWI
jgi:hypothetical protein